jgi:hypothetical protein
MKKIINGAKYDTATAKKLGEWTNGHMCGDFNYCEERLYRTKSGKYFLYGTGNAASKYSKVCGDNNRCGDSQIITMSRAAAMEWAEENLDGDDYEAAFGEVTDDGTEQLNITIPAVLKAKLWEMAEQRKISVSALAEEILQKACTED